MHKWEKDVQVILGRWVANCFFFFISSLQVSLCHFQSIKEVIYTVSGESKLRVNIQINNLTSCGTIKGNFLLVGQNYAWIILSVCSTDKNTGS